MPSPYPGPDFTRIDVGAFAACPEDSIDYAVMERKKDTEVVPIVACRSDTGS
jgi:mannose-1-phosphate guanylyltransferase